MSSTPQQLDALPAHAVPVPATRLRRFRFDRPQQFAALLLFLLLAQCLFVIVRQPLTDADYQYARCGREMWERPSPIAGYFTTCGNIHDGALAYRLAGLPLTAERILAGQSADTSTWEMRHELGFVSLLLRLPFAFAAVLLGGALWWVTRRLYGNRGGYVALALYSVAPPVIRAATSPNPEILTALGFFAAIYTAIGVAHAMQGPRHKWRPRILLLAAAFGLVAASHSAALLLALPLAAVFMLYLAERRRTVVPFVLIAGTLGALLLVFACYAFHPDAFSYYFRSGAGRLGLSLLPLRHLLSGLSNAGITLALLSAVVLYLFSRRSHYFGNTAPLVTSLLLLPLVTTGTLGEPTLWALPFVFTFIGGVFADALESPRRVLFRWAIVGLILLQTALSIATVAAPAVNVALAR
ncbi:MAG: glycosyltransferase family 39 protein [Acidobacteriaceae bacterium]